MDFKGKNVLITGGGNGIGAATAKKFAGYGASVIVTDLDQASAVSVANEIVKTGGNAIGLKLDITAIADWNAVATETHAKYGKVNVVFNNAYLKIVKPAHLTSVEEWDKQIDVNFGGIHKSVITFIADLQDTNGAMVNTSSVHAHFGFLGSGAYNQNGLLVSPAGSYTNTPLSGAGTLSWNGSTTYTWTPGVSTSASYLVVGGGGSGGYNYGSGGGGGAVISSTTTLSGSYSIVVGSGGAASTGIAPTAGGSSGTASSAFGITAAGG